MLIGKRRGLLEYLRKKDTERYRVIDGKARDPQVTADPDWIDLDARRAGLAGPRSLT